MAKRNRQTSQKREREMARNQRKRDKAERIAARRADRNPQVDPGRTGPTPGDNSDHTK